MPAADPITVELIDAELPQTQCGKCGHDGCRPYAEAIVDGEAINRCPPGGEATRDRLAALTGRPALALIEPPQTPLLAVIREAECIGCTKCIQACPVDAILGAAKQMHTVIESECTGCELCVAPCPVDCIDLIAHPQWAEAENDAQRQTYLDWRATNGRRRFDARRQRLVRKAEEKQKRRQQRLARIARPEEAAPVSAAVDTTALKAQRATLTAKLRRARKALAQASAEDAGIAAARVDQLAHQLDQIEARLAGTATKAPKPHRQIAVAAAEQAMRKARQELAHFQRQQDEHGMAQARDKIHHAEQLISRAGQAADGASNFPEKRP